MVFQLFPETARAGRFAALTGAMALFAVVTSAEAAPIGYTAWDVSGNDKLVRFDLATGQGQVIGSGMGFGDVDGLAFDGAGKLWGVDDDTNRLIGIDLNTGVGSSVGAFGSGFNDMGLAFGNDTMFMAATNTAATLGSLYSVNLTTGSASLIGSFGDGLKVRSLGFYDNTLYGWSNIDTLVTINTSTGATTTIGDFGFASPTIGRDGMDADPATGVLWSIADVERRIYTLNRLTGQATVVTNSLTCNGGSCSAGGFNSLAIAPTPVPLPAAAPLLMGGVMALGFLRRRVGGTKG